MEAVQVLMNAGAYPNHMEVDNERLTPLDYAIIGGHQEIAQYLIEQQALTISGIKELAASLIQVNTNYLVYCWISGCVNRNITESTGNVRG